ncbi:hypothetical protein [Helicobacter rodentium]|uniref:capsular polysaccharide export protein, LipB/KpsS family n=1 Tax=Helicobacter rodentium TaxID=59617 RepID=UPI0006921BB4|nr:hypothetical protein [Helicobacter rodentium]
MPKLSIIIPFGTSVQREYIKQRVIEKALNAKSIDEVEYLFVEGYSSYICEELPKIIQESGHQYIKDTTQQQKGAFSQGACRNLGAIYANAPVIMPLDVDYYLSMESLKKILQLIEIKQIHKNPNQFLILPCIFLNESGSEFIIQAEEDKRDNLLLHDINSKQNMLNRFFAPASSSFVMNRHKYLEIGGNDLEFVGHGYEDFDLMNRILKTCATFESLPRNLDFDYRNWSFNDFKGFRSWFSIVGYESIFYGIWLYHLWHIEPNQNGYLDNREKNHQKFYRNLKRFKNLSDGVDCLQDKMALGKKVLLFTAENSSVYKALRGVSVYIGELVCKREYEFFTEEKFDEIRFLEFLKEWQISCVLFPNAYGNTQRILIYKFVKDSKIPFVVFDRGAFSDSWFFDTQGCNYDSPSYLPKYWDKPLSSLQKEQTQDYIESLLNGEKFLQAQGQRIGGAGLRRKLGIRHKRVIFVPLQTQNDSVILHFTYEPFSWEGFLEIINQVARSYANDDIVFCVKKHPLTLNIEKDKYDSLLFVPDNTNFMDLLEICCGAVMINSGVGVYAMISGKACVLCGNAFYSHQGLNLSAKDEEELRAQIHRILSGEFQVDNEKMLSFVHYLWKEFYSYGQSQVKQIKDSENNRMVEQVVSIDFYKIRVGGQSYLEATSVEKNAYTLKSLAYKPYLYEIKNTKTKSFSIPLLNKVFSKVSHTKFFRLFRKLLTRPKDFVMDSKNPLVKQFRIFVK